MPVLLVGSNPGLTLHAEVGGGDGGGDGGGGHGPGGSPPRPSSTAFLAEAEVRSGT